MFSVGDLVIHKTSNKRFVVCHIEVEGDNQYLLLEWFEGNEFKREKVPASSCLPMGV